MIKYLFPFSFVFLAAHLMTANAFADIESNLPTVGMHPGRIAYWDTPYFANAMSMGFGWTSSINGRVHSNSEQLNENGYPRYLEGAERIWSPIYGFATNFGTSTTPIDWPKRSTLAEGYVVLEWQGNADIRLNGGAWVSSDSSGGATGSLTNGRRAYRFTNGTSLGLITLYAIDENDPISDIKVWLADPDDPENKALEDELFHPLVLERLSDTDWGYLRMMDWIRTNASPQQDWSDRRLPSHAFMSGVLNRRSPAEGIVWFTNAEGEPVYLPGDKTTGAAFEYMVALANETDLDLWINIPHLATDDFVRKFAQLIRYGSDADGEPYSTTQTNPVYAPLESELKVYVEYSNEIWASSGSFAQGIYAQAQADAVGLSKAEWNARRFCEVWSIFEDVYSGSEDSLVNVAAVFTAHEGYTTDFLDEIASYGPTLSPAVLPEAIACSTYFGNGIQDWVEAKAREMIGTEDPWFYTDELFDDRGNMKPVSLPASDPYWTSNAFERHQTEAFREWNRRMLSGSAAEGSGPDATSQGGGFDRWLYQLANTTFPTSIPLIAYEGGPSLYTDAIDGGSLLDDGITIFISDMNRNSAFEGLYRTHLNTAISKGLWSHTAFVISSKWGKNGQWGHLESLDQLPAESPKYQFMLDWSNEAQSIRHISQPLNNVPRFDTDINLPPIIPTVPYSTDITVSGGDGARQVSVINALLEDGLEISFPNADTIRVSGQITGDRLGYIYARVIDADGDAAWQTFTLKAVGGPGTLVESNFEGTNTALHLPWDQVYFQDPNISFSGWETGPGTTPRDGDNALFFHLRMPADEDDSTLALAIADGEYWTSTVQATTDRLNLRNEEVQISVQRAGFHSPRRYAVFTSIQGFDEGSAVFVSDYSRTSLNQEFVFRLPDEVAYANVTEAVEIRIYGFSGQYANHKSSITHFKLRGDTGALPVEFSIANSELPSGRIGIPYNVPLSAVNGTSPLSWALSNHPNWLTIDDETGELQGTPSASYNQNIDITATDDNANAASASLLLTIEDPFVAWLSERELPADSDESDDLQKEGIPLLLRHALGLPAKEKATDLLPYLKINSENAKLFTLTRNTQASGVILRVQQSEDMKQWDDVYQYSHAGEILTDATVESRTVENDNEHIRLRLDNSANLVFLRVQVTR